MTRVAAATASGHLGTFACIDPYIMILTQVPPAAERDTPLRFPLSNRLTSGAVAMLPSFNSAWFSQTGVGRQMVILLVLAAIAVLALLIAGSAFLRGERRSRSAIDDEELFTTTPLPMPQEQLARLAKQSPQHAFTVLRIPRWMQAGSLVVALGITWMVARRLAPGDGVLRGKSDVSGARAAGARDVAEDSPEDLDLAADSSPAFAFRVRDWVARDGGGCSGRLEVTKGEPNGWSLVARVHDGKGQLIDTARARVATLREGDVVEFAFPRADCDRIGAWDVRGARRQ
jgi:hypothetical protein